MNRELCYLPVHEAIAQFEARTLSPVEVMDAVLAQSERMHPMLNATTAIFAEDALRQARESEHRYRLGSARPLEGVPVAIKEETAVAGWPRTNGSLLLDETPVAHHPIVDKLFQAGAIPHIQTTVPEFCVIGQTWSRRWGVTRNPWNRALTCGGSSGGSAAALAAGQTPLATGSDMAGSIRIPAALQGLYGYKPPFGRLTATPGEELFAFAVEGPMARNLTDLTLMQNVIAGPHPAGYVGMPAPILPTGFGDLTGWRIGYALQTGCATLCPDTRDNLLRACDALRGCGAIVEPVDLRWDNAEIAESLVEGIFGLFFAEYLQDIDAPQLLQVSSYLDMLIRKYRGRPNSIMNAVQLASRLHGELQTKLWSRGFRALLCPTVFTTQIDADLDIRATRAVMIEGLAVDSYLGWVGTPPFNLLSRYPAMAVPTGRARNGVPTSLQIVAQPFDDASAFQVAFNLERTGLSSLFRSEFPALD